jgi:hypothetical protein
MSRRRFTPPRRNHGPKVFAICYDWELINTLKTSHIQIKSAISRTLPISLDSGKIAAILILREKSHKIKGLA